MTKNHQTIVVTCTVLECIETPLLYILTFVGHINFIINLTGFIIYIVQNKTKLLYKFITVYINIVAFFIADSLLYEKVVHTLTQHSLVNGIKQASPLEQTSCLEGFHSVLNHFAPKMIAYSYTGQYCRYIQYCT